LLIVEELKLKELFNLFLRHCVDASRKRSGSEKNR
jgi:hypothetical protein